MLQMPAFLPRPFSASSAVNSLGIDLLRATASPNANALISPYSIELALAMAYAGADGSTREEMARVLHLSGDEAQILAAFSALQKEMEAVRKGNAERAAFMKRHGLSDEVVTLEIANRLFGQRGYDFRPPFLEVVKTNYGAPFEPLDFRKDSAGAAKWINDWIADKTKQRIRDLIPAGALDRLTRLVLVNAVYFKARWAHQFSAAATKPLSFHVAGGAPEDVPTMAIRTTFGYARGNGVSVVTIPYEGCGIQCLIILPDDVDGLAKTETTLTANRVEKWANLPAREVKLYLPKFKIEPPTLQLAKALQRMGMNSAFDNPPMSANFDRIAPRRFPEDYLSISEVYHKTFMNLDEDGTEAAAATAIAMRAAGIVRQPPQPVEVRVDHPFIFAIQHRVSGACLFLGHVVDPR